MFIIVCCVSFSMNTLNKNVLVNLCAHCALPQIATKYQKVKFNFEIYLFFSSILSISVLKNAFDAFDQEKNGFINTTMVGTILGMLGHQLDEKMLLEIVAEVDEDGSGQIEFEEFCTLAARFLVEEDAEAMQQELKEAFRLYDKEGAHLMNIFIDSFD